MIQVKSYPVLFQLGSIKIYTYGTILALALLLALYLIIKQAKKERIENEHAYNIVAYMALLGLIGARLIYLLINANEFSSFYDVLAMWKGGYSGIGAVLFSIMAVYLYSKAKKLNFFQIMDIIIPYAILVAVFGRVACFLRGCCHGLPTNLPWGILYEQGSIAGLSGFSVPVHPTQLYHMLANLFIFAILFFALRAKSGKKYKVHGKVFALFLILFPLQRILIDFLRYYPERYYMGSFTIFQLGYFALFLSGISLFFMLSKQAKKASRKL
jgi:phosphatidylglycerol:prolipoprotein diacylglycerol transferase